MALELSMFGLIAQDMNRSLEFYRRLGLAIPPGSEGQPHVEIKMKGELTFFLNVPERIGGVETSGSPRVILEF